MSISGFERAEEFGGRTRSNHQAVVQKRPYTNGGCFGDVYRNKRVLITGNTGFKGAWLSTWLLKLGANVYGLSKDVPTTPSIFETMGLAERVQHTVADVRDLDSIRNRLAEIRPEFIFHLAAQPIVSESYLDPVTTIATNVLGTTHLLQAVREANIPCKVISITSDKCYENVEWTWGYRENDRLGGKDPYSASKAATEIIIRTFHEAFFSKDDRIHVVSVRAGNVIGGGDWAADRIVPDCIRAWSQGEPVFLRRPNATRPWQHVLEPLSGYLRVGQKLYESPEHAGNSYNFGPNPDQNHTVLELLEAIASYWRFQGDHERYRIEDNTLFHEAGLLKLNCDKALHELGWKPVLQFDETARFTAQWYNKFYHDPAFSIQAMQEQISEYEMLAGDRTIAWVA